ncbi:hypothetical protein HGP28_02745 [Vibrio sp. SM6]|uniref:Molecular chaperone n=1 Tax=Vibrio agarilyticus TaxID=2726741 RepID=A0A7X8TNM7_9VIBR|nr:hypothetical protein [Vibrio agarilyticus]NLS11807.1 hypothetical protein [Vibrio agarilyticus]
MNVKLTKLMTFALSASIFNSHAIGIDSIITVAENGKGTFTVSNNDGYRQFITVGISDINIVKGQLESTPYTKENIADWTLEVRPARLIVNDGQHKKFSVRYTGTPNKSHDKIYQLTVAPSPYYEEGEKPLQSVQLAVGFAPYVIVPALEDQPIQYDISYEKGRLKVHNKGDSYLHLTIDACPDTLIGKERNACVKTSYALSDRLLEVPIEPHLEEKLKLSLKTNNNKYKEQFTILPSQNKIK